MNEVWGNELQVFNGRPQTEIITAFGSCWNFSSHVGVNWFICAVVNNSQTQETKESTGAQILVSDWFQNLGESAASKFFLFAKAEDLYSPKRIRRGEWPTVETPLLSRKIHACTVRVMTPFLLMVHQHEHSSSVKSTRSQNIFVTTNPNCSLWHRLESTDFATDLKMDETTEKTRHTLYDDGFFLLGAKFVSNLFGIWNLCGKWYQFSCAFWPKMWCENLAHKPKN